MDFQLKSRIIDYINHEIFQAYYHYYEVEHCHTEIFLKKMEEAISEGLITADMVDTEIGRFPEDVLSASWRVNNYIEVLDHRYENYV